jgi:hypothetical protein
LVRHQGVFAQKREQALVPFLYFLRSVVAHVEKSLTVPPLRAAA